MIVAKPEDHALMTLSIKRRGKFVDLPHVREKLTRDTGKKFSDDEVRELLDGLVERGLVQAEGGGYSCE